VNQRCRCCQAALFALSIALLPVQSLASDIEGWWQSWDSLLFIAVEQGEARVFAAGILNPSLVKGEQVSWSLEEPLTDLENSDPNLRNRSLLGLEVGDDLRRSGKRWQGRIYDPRSGTWYKSRLSIVDGQLNIRGYIGMPMLGQTRVFDPYEPCEDYEDKAMVIWSGAKPPACSFDSEAEPVSP
jgi:uncharacterized protein (DUF2147 family)